jgi:hypothetical protein
MKKSIKFLLFFAVAIANSGCSVLYDINQDRVGQYCDSLLNEADRYSCKQRNRTSYEDYERDRQKVKNGTAQK